MKDDRKKKRETQAQETHRNILRAAVRLFARQGYHKTTIADLAQAIGLTTGAIFHHFSSKEALLEAVVDWLCRGIRIYSDMADRADSDSFDIIKKILIVMCDHFKKNPEATICLAALATEFAGSGHPMEIKLKETYEVFVGSFSRVLGNHPQIEDPRAAAISFVGSVQGIAIQGLLRKEDVTIDQLALGFFSMLTASWQMKAMESSRSRS